MRAVILIGVLVAGCGTDVAPAPAGPPTFSAIYSMLFPRATKYQCEFCHGLPANEVSNGKLSMGYDQPSAYAALVGKTSASEACNGKPLVVPGDPDNSLLIEKLDRSPSCGDEMPLAGARLSSAQLEQVREWILEGAQDN